MGATGEIRAALASAAVSTHAPVMGATPLDSSTFGILGVSTHAPVMGATVLFRFTPACGLTFQPTRP